MTYSLNEIEALAKKAARGAGRPWGVAEEAGKAVRWLVSNGLPGCEALAGLLAETDGRPEAERAPVALEGVWTSRAGTLCPLTSGAALNDCAEAILEGTGVEMGQVAHPLLVVPFAGWAAIHLETLVVVSWGDVRIGTDGWAVWIADSGEVAGGPAPADLSCRVAREIDAPKSTPALRGAIAPDVWKRLDAFAHRTYAPATEASRLLGAGAGVSDND